MFSASGAGDRSDFTYFNEKSEKVCTIHRVHKRRLTKWTNLFSAEKLRGWGCLEKYEFRFKTFLLIDQKLSLQMAQDHQRLE